MISALSLPKSILLMLIASQQHASCCQTIAGEEANETESVGR